MPAKEKLGIAAWCYYDWANSAFTTIVITFVFATYFVSAIAVDPILGAAQWGFAISASALLRAAVSELDIGGVVGQDVDGVEDELNVVELQAV